MDATRQQDQGPVRLLLTVREAAKALSVCEKTLWTMTNEGQIPAIPVGKRGVRYSLDDLKAWISQQSQERSRLPK